MNWLKTLGRALRVISVAPYILRAALEISDGLEDAITGPNKGQQKKQIAKDAMSLTLDTAAEVSGEDLPKDSLMRMFDGMIDMSVAGYNLVGNFKKNNG